MYLMNLKYLMNHLNLRSLNYRMNLMYLMNLKYLMYHFLKYLMNH